MRSISTVRPVLIVFAVLGLAVGGCGTLSTSLGAPKRFVEVEPFLWDEVDGHDRLQAEVRDGKVWRWATAWSTW